MVFSLRESMPCKVCYSLIPPIFGLTIELSHPQVSTFQNLIVGIFDGFYFTGIFIYLLLNAVIPLTTSSGWHTWVDVVAVGFYLSGVIFLLPIALMELGIIFKKKTSAEKMKIHFILVGGFLVVAHVAMIFGMVNPEIVNNMSSIPSM